MSSKSHFDWTVIGAGPAGIAAVCKILNLTDPSPKVLWLDPDFSVGYLGRLWQNVSGNTKVSYFTDFLSELSPFNTNNSYALYACSPEETCDLKYIAEPLQDISLELTKKTQIERCSVTHLTLTNNAWSIKTSTDTTYTSRRVILATGASAISLDENKELIPLDIAIDKKKLAKHIHPNDKVAVFGASHSAILVLKHLCELNVEKIYNIYKSPCKYAQTIGNDILFDNTGLKGIAAEWAKKYIDGKQPDNLQRVAYNAQNNYPEIKDANLVVHAIGFRPNLNIICEQYDLSHYCPSTGIIAPGLFGFGIAFPEKITSNFGYTEYQVGLWKFMTYIKRVLPLWQTYRA